MSLKLIAAMAYFALFGVYGQLAFMNPDMRQVIVMMAYAILGVTVLVKK